jgi:hypothetical protein
MTTTPCRKCGKEVRLVSFGYGFIGICICGELANVSDLPPDRQLEAQAEATATEMAGDVFESMALMTREQAERIAKEKGDRP